VDTIYGEAFINAIKSVLPEAKPVAGRKELVVRCRYCGDSRDLSHAHLYIKVPQNSQELALYDCKKCPAHGVVDEAFLQKYSVSDASLLVAITKHNNAVYSSPNYRKYAKFKVYPLLNNTIRQEPENQHKLDYINSRIGSNFNYEDILKLKMFLNLYDVINANNIGITRHKSITDQLDEFFIGFISYDNTKTNMRKCYEQDVYQSINKRYINYNFIDKPDSVGYYIIPTIVDLYNPTPIKIHITEGPFDILSVYYNLNNCNNIQNIYCSCGGKGFAGAIQFILKETGIINYEIHIYPDADQSQDEINYVLITCETLLSLLYEHHNVFPGEKDYGVPIDRIKDSVIRRL